MLDREVRSEHGPLGDFASWAFPKTLHEAPREMLRYSISTP
jgi:hypothetical protein